MRRYSSPEKRYVTLGLPSFAGTASITDSAVAINLHLSSGKPIYVLNHQPTLGRFLHADDGHVDALLGMSTKVEVALWRTSLRARPRRGGPVRNSYEPGYGPAEPPSGLAQVHDYELQVRQLCDREADALPPHPTHLNSAERSVVPPKVRPVVDEHGACLHLLCELDSTCQIRSEDRSLQPVDRAVGCISQVLLARDLHDGRDRTEYLL